MYRLAVLADIHGNLPALEAVLDDLQRRGKPDAMWVLGDLAAFYPWPAETIDLLRSLPGTSFIRGNTDRYLVTGQRHIIPVRTEKEWDRFPQALALRDECFRWMVEQFRYEDFLFLQALPASIETEIGGFGRILGVHGLVGDDEAGVEPDTPEEDVRENLKGRPARLVLSGHTHIPMQRLVDNVLLINPGSVGCSSSGRPIASYALLEFEGQDRQVGLWDVPYDGEKVRTQLMASSYPGAKGMLLKMQPG